MIVQKLNTPASDFIALSFKMKATARNAGTGLKVVANGVSAAWMATRLRATTRSAVFCSLRCCSCATAVARS